MTPFRSEKDTNWEGAFRVPAMVRWPGRIKAGSVSNEILSGLDWLPTLMAPVGDPDIKEKLLRGTDVGGTTYKVHLDGCNRLPYLTGQDEKGARRDYFYFNDDGDFVAVRYENWKFVFEEQCAQGTIRIWAEPFTKLRLVKMFNLRADPYERADITSNTYWDWEISNGGLMYGALTVATRFLQTFKEFPPSQRPGSFTLDQAVEQLYGTAPADSLWRLGRPPAGSLEGASARTSESIARHAAAGPGRSTRREQSQ